MKIEEGVELSRYTTLGTGGPARAFARPEIGRRGRGALCAGRPSAASPSRSSASARTCSPPTTGVDALVLKLGGELARGRGRRRASCGRAAARRTRSCLHRARAAGLGGFEFACAIPGTIGGGVWMNAGAYGGDFSQVLERALVATAEGSGWLTPAELGLSYRHSDLRHGQVVVAGRAAARGRVRPGEIKAEVARAQRAAQGRAADEQAHVRQRLQESRARAERGADARGVRAEGPPHRRGADLAEARELHRERRRRADRGRARADGRGAPPRARAVRRRAAPRGRAPRRSRVPPLG